MRILSKLFDKFEEFFVSGGIILTCFILFVNVVTRYFGYSLKWAEEFTRYMIIWITFIGSSMCVRNYAHVGIDVVVSRLSARSQLLMKLVVWLIGVGFSFVMFILGIQIVSQVMGTKQLTPAMMIPMWIPYLGIPIGCFLMTVRYFQEVSKVFKELNDKEAESGCRT